MNKEILANAKLIATYMGYAPVIAEGWGGINLYKGPNDHLMDLAGTKYHESWDSLMPVIEKLADKKPVAMMLLEICGDMWDDISEVYDSVINHLKNK